MLKLTKRVQRAGGEGAFVVMAKAQELERQGKSMIYMQIGEPDFNTPENIKQAGMRAIEQNYTHYAPTMGRMDFREAVAAYVAKTRGIPMGADEILVTPGAKDAIYSACMTLLEDGDEAIYPNPAYPIYESCINISGAKAVPLPILEEKDFGFDRDTFVKLVSPRTRLVVINSPTNPTGGILAREDLELVAEMAQKYDFYVLSDEIYSRLVFEGEHFSIASLPGMKERTIIVDGMSKTYAMTGWRLGYAAGPREVVNWMSKIIANTASCTATFTQLAGIEALTGPQDDVEKMRQEFMARRDIIVQGLNGIPGVTCRMPHGAFYVFPNIKSYGKTSKEVADYLLYNAGVACLAGTDFGSYGEGYLRLSYATSRENIATAMGRIRTALAELK
ncbi:MAG TPA: pyridoxal phosphate-dependent aminotransferase [Candidatus Cryosericum sp.]|nr:pyridoxal phosphate-dependent aminotransferase [Candidatus Cryosericum sp.]